MPQARVRAGLSRHNSCCPECSLTQDTAPFPLLHHWRVRQAPFEILLWLIDLQACAEQTDWSSKEYWGPNLIWESVSRAGLYQFNINVRPFVCLPAEHKTISRFQVSSTLLEVIYRFFFYSLSGHLLQLALGFSTVQGPLAGTSCQWGSK